MHEKLQNIDKSVVGHTAKMTTIYWTFLKVYEYNNILCVCLLSFSQVWSRLGH